MPGHDTPLIATIAAGLVLAFVFGMLAHRMRLSPLVGYLAAGVLVGPFTPGFVADAELAGELAEIGVILLMFGVGLHFSPKELMAVRAIALPGAIVQIGVGPRVGMGLRLGPRLGARRRAGVSSGWRFGRLHRRAAARAAGNATSREELAASRWVAERGATWRWSSRLGCCRARGPRSRRTGRDGDGRRGGLPSRSRC
jgi:hypothetical protein